MAMAASVAKKHGTITNGDFGDCMGNPCMTLIGVHSTMHLVHPSQCHVTTCTVCVCVCAYMCVGV